MSRRTEIAYKAEEADKGAQHSEVRGKHASTVNAAVVQRKCVFLSRETCGICVPGTESGGGSNVGATLAGVSRSHSTVDLTGRAERKERGRPRRERSLR